MFSKLDVRGVCSVHEQELCNFFKLHDKNLSKSQAILLILRYGGTVSKPFITYSKFVQELVQIF